MNSIFNPTENDAMIARINKLTPESYPLWGRMSVDQMCRHCNLAIAVAYGEQDLKINILLKLLGKMLKKKVLYGGHLKKESPTAKEFIVKDHSDLENAKAELITNFSRFKEGHPSIKVMNHPFWGTLNYEEWDLLMWKHLDHHLRQFGV